jgi:1-acyl-sn-glycerol-3-phosphate acyltransferase
MGFIFLAGTVLCGGITLFVPKTYSVRLSRRTTSSVFNLYLNLCEFLGLMCLDLQALDILNEKNNDEAMVLVANHPSLIDVVLLTARLRTCTCIAKDSLIQHAVLGISARANDYISNASVSQMLKKAIALNQAGSHVLIFPEGTRTRLDGGNLINNLGGSASIIAKRSKSKIQLIYIHTNSGFLGAQWPILKRPEFPIVYTIRLGVEINFNQSLDESTKNMKHAFENNLLPIKIS